MMIQM